jgi:hypothetical protein
MPVTLSLKHAPSDREQPCAVCGAQFVPSEDSGSRLFSMSNAKQPSFSVLMCGGCHSKWSHGATVSLKETAPR